MKPRALIPTVKTRPEFLKNEEPRGKYSIMSEMSGQNNSDNK